MASEYCQLMLGQSRGTQLPGDSSARLSPALAAADDDDAELPRQRMAAWKNRPCERRHGVDVSKDVLRSSDLVKHVSSFFNGPSTQCL